MEVKGRNKKCVTFSKKVRKGFILPTVKTFGYYDYSDRDNMSAVLPKEIHKNRVDVKAA